MRDRKCVFFWFVWFFRTFDGINTVQNHRLHIFIFPRSARSRLAPSFCRAGAEWNGSHLERAALICADLLTIDQFGCQQGLSGVSGA